MFSCLPMDAKRCNERRSNTLPKTLKIIFGRGSAPDPAGGAHDAPPDPLVGWGGGYLLPIPHPLDAFGVSAPRIPFRPCVPNLPISQVKKVATLILGWITTTTIYLWKSSKFVHQDVSSRKLSLQHCQSLLIAILAIQACNSIHIMQQQPV